MKMPTSSSRSHGRQRSSRSLSGCRKKVISVGQTGSNAFRRKWRRRPLLKRLGAMKLPYYEQWLNAAEKLLISKGVTTKEQLLAKRFAVDLVGSTHVLK